MEPKWTSDESVCIAWWSTNLSGTLDRPAGHQHQQHHQYPVVIIIILGVVAACQEGLLASVRSCQVSQIVTSGELGSLCIYMSDGLDHINQMLDFIT